MGQTMSIPMSALRTCPKFSWDPKHWNHYEEDGRCNCDRVCGYTDADGGPCILLVDAHKTRADRTIIHDDGKRWTKPHGWVR